jgi:hypothetical protein
MPSAKFVDIVETDDIDGAGVEDFMVITVELSLVTPFSVALTKIPTVPTVLPAVNVIEEPLPLIDPIPLFVRDHEYEMPEGHVAVHVGVAVNVCWPPVFTEGLVGLTDTEVRETEAVIVISVDAVFVTLLYVALTKMPTIPAVLPA